MQLLVPPLDDSGRGDFGSKTGDGSLSNSPTAAAHSVMSQGLYDKFQTMTQVWNHPSNASAKRSEAPLPSSSTQGQVAEQEEEDFQPQNKKRKVAIETALAIESEVQKWQRGIAELEAMLEEEASGEDAPSSSSSSNSSKVEARAEPPNFVRFPVLPPIIPAEEGDFEESDDDDNDDDHDD